MRILILGDSLPSPRPDKGQPLEATWPGLLRKHFPDADVWQRARPRSCTLDVLAEFKLFTDSLTRFDAVVVQTGIVDCWPRPYPRWFIKVFEVFATFEQLRAFDRRAHRSFLWLYGRPWVTPGAFRANLTRLVETARQLNPGLKILLVPIVPPTRRMLADFAGVDRAASVYNAVLREVAERHGPAAVALDPFSAHPPLSLTIEDGHHLTALGHVRIADCIARELSPAGTALLPRPAKAPAAA